MKNINYKTKISAVIAMMMIACVTEVYASEVSGTLSTGLGNNSVNGIVISAPTASPSAGTHTSAQSVTLLSSGSINIRYTTDGTDPTCSVGSVYASAISVPSTQTIKAISCYANNASSSIASLVYTINIPAVVTSTGGGGGGGYYYNPSGGMVSVVAPVVQGEVKEKPKGEVLGASAFNFTKDLSVGSTGEDVIELQKILIAGGFLNIANPTDYFGALTKSALIKWQTKNNLPSTGYFGPMTRELISSMTVAPTVLTGKVVVATTTATTTVTFNFTKDLRMGHRSDDVKELQRMLISEGFLKTTATGYFGQSTKNALSKWQAKNNLPATGYFGSMTRELITKPKN